MKDRSILIEAAVLCTDKCKQYTKGMNITEFLVDVKTQDAVIRNIEVIGQIVKDFGIDDLILDYPATRWREIAGMRNIMAHEYLGVDLNIVWEAVNSHIIPLNEVFLNVLKDLDNGH